MSWKTINRNIILIGLVTMLIVTVTDVGAQVATGGSFTISQSVVASGAAASSGGTYLIEGSTGQHTAGGFLQNAQFSLYSGFWSAIPLGPTAAPVSISGRVRTAGGVGIQNVLLRLTNSSGESWNVRSSSFGYYRFDDLAAGQTYILSLTSRRYVFSQSIRVLSAIDNLEAIDFIAD